MKNLMLALLGTLFLVSAAEAAPARCTLKDGGWLTGDKKTKASSPQQCELRNALYGFGGQKFGVSTTDPEIISASRKGYAASGGRNRLTTNPYAQDVSAFLAAVKKDAAKSKSKRRYNLSQLAAGFSSLADFSKIPEDVQFRFDTTSGLPVLHSPYRTRYKLSSFEEVRDDSRECYMGIDVTGLALGGTLDACPRGAPVEMIKQPAKRKAAARRAAKAGKKAAAVPAPVKSEACASRSIQEAAQTGADCG